MDRKPKLPDHESAAQLRPQPDAIDQMFAECARRLDLQLGKELDAERIDELLEESKLHAGAEAERSVPSARAAASRPGVALYVLPDPEPDPEFEALPQAHTELNTDSDIDIDSGSDIDSDTAQPQGDGFVEVYTRIERGEAGPDFNPKSDPMIWDLRACEAPDPDADDASAPAGATPEHGGASRLWRWLFDRQGARSGRSPGR